MNKSTKKQVTRRTEEEKLFLIQEWEKAAAPSLSFAGNITWPIPGFFLKKELPTSKRAAAAKRIYSPADQPCLRCSPGLPFPVR